MTWLHETGTRLQIGMNVYLKHAGSSYLSFVVCFIVPFTVKCRTANKNTAESEEKRENYSVSSPHKHSSFKRKERIPKNPTSLIFFRLFPAVIRHLGMSNNTLAHAHNSDLWPVSNQFVFTWFRGPTSDRSESFVLVQQPEWVKPARDDFSNRLHVNRNKHLYGDRSHVIRALLVPVPTTSEWLDPNTWVTKRKKKRSTRSWWRIWSAVIF